MLSLIIDCLKMHIEIDNAIDGVDMLIEGFFVAGKPTKKLKYCLIKLLDKVKLDSKLCV